MTAAAVIAAGMALAMVMVVMIALDIGIECQLAGNERFHCCVRIAGNAAVQLDARRSQCHLRTTADAAADQNICIQSGQDTCQRAVSAAHGIDNFRCNDLTLLHIIDLKLLGVAEVLENLAVFVSDCNSHRIYSFRFFIFSVD